LAPHRARRPPDPGGNLRVGQLPQQPQLRLRPPRPVVAGDEVPPEVQPLGDAAPVLPLLLGDPALPARRTALRRRGSNQSVRPLVVGLRDAERLPPPPDGAFTVGYPNIKARPVGSNGYAPSRRAAYPNLNRHVSYT